MWSALRTRRYLLLSGGKAYLREVARPWHSGATEVATFAENEAAKTLATPKKTTLRPRLEVILGSALCRLVALDRPPGIRADAEAAAIVQSHAAKKMGLKETEWSVIVDNRRRRQILVCAVRRSTIAKIQEWAESSGHRLASIRPLATIGLPGPGARGYRRTIKHGWTFIEDDAVASIDFCGGIVRLASSRTTADDVQFTIERIRLSVGEGRPSKAFVFQVAGQPNSTRRDFLDLFTEEVVS